MRRAIFAATLLLTCALSASPQKFPTARGDAWNGKVEAVDAATREITLTSLAGSKPETFKGVLDIGFRARLLDDSVAQPDISEIPLGMRVRAYYETVQENVGGKKVKVNHVSAVLFLGRDDFDRLRVRLHLAPSASVAAEESGQLPAANPLKIYVTLDPPRTKDEFVKWASRWNKEDAGKYGQIEIVSDAAQADVSLVVYNTVMELSEPLPFSEGNVVALPSALAFLVVPRAGGVSVLWRYTPLFSGPRSTVLTERVEKEIERLLKARSKDQKN
jgi:hypothetical protein